MPSLVKAETGTRWQPREAAARGEARQPVRVRLIDLVGGDDPRKDRRRGSYAASSAFHRRQGGDRVLGPSDTSTTWTRRRVRSMWRRKRMPSPAPWAAPSISPGMSATTKPPWVGRPRRQIRAQGGEGIGGNLGSRRREGGEQRRLARVGQSH